jgi:integrator complex subunit 4
MYSFHSQHCRRMKYCYIGLNIVLEVQVLELSLIDHLCRLSKIAVCSKVVLGATALGN